MNRFFSNPEEGLMFGEKTYHTPTLVNEPFSGIFIQPAYQCQGSCSLEFLRSKPEFLSLPGIKIFSVLLSGFSSYLCIPKLVNNILLCGHWCHSQRYSS